MFFLTNKIANWEWTTHVLRVTIQWIIKLEQQQKMISQAVRFSISASSFIKH